MSRSRTLVLLFAILFLLPGCFPGIAWKPDSSGFVYTDKKGSRLLDFDLKTNKPRVLVADTGTHTSWPALSPDGKRIAVARHETRKGRTARAQVILYSAAGKEERRSTWFEFQTKPSNADNVEETVLIWGTPNRVLLLSEGTNLYDVEKDRLITVPDCMPWIAGTVALRPDGKGFLAYNEGPDGLELLFVDWDGNKQVIEGKLPKEPNWIFIGWDKDVALLHGGGSQLAEVDTAKLTLTESKRKPIALLPTDGERLAYWTFPTKPTALSLDKLTEKKPGVQREYHRFVLHDLAARKPTVLVPDCEAMPLFFPSPDRQYLAVFSQITGSKDTKILVLNADGKTVAEVKLEE